MRLDVTSNFDPLAAFVTALQAAQPRILRAMGDAILEEALRLVPRDSGDLADTGKVTVRGDAVHITFGGKTKGGKRVLYALIVHEGEVKVKSGSKQFLRLAATNLPLIQAAMAKAAAKEWERMERELGRA